MKFVEEIANIYPDEKKTTASYSMVA